MSNKKGCPQENRKRHAPKGCIYPNIAAWMQANCCGCTDLARRTDFSISGVRSALVGNYSPSKPMIDAILDITGMTYEIAFAKELKT